MGRAILTSRGSWIVAAVCLASLLPLVYGCSETKERIVEVAPDVEGDDTLPSGVVTANRPRDPGTSYELPCPWGVVEEPLVENDAFTGVLFPDDIPSIDFPRFLPVTGPDLPLLDNEFVVAVEVGGHVRAFPIRILLHHEIVNMCWDTPEGRIYTFLSYCPLTDAAINFTDPRGCDRKNKFGVSGAIYNGNLVLYDRRFPNMDAIYVQMYAGGLRGTCAEIVGTAQTMTWLMFKRLYPNGEVLSGDTGFERNYDFWVHPYADYWRRGDLWFPLTQIDTRLARMTKVFGVLTPGGQRAYVVSNETYVKNDDIGGARIVAWNDGALVATMAFERVVDGRELTFEFAGREAHGLPLFRDLETDSYWNFEGIAVEGELKGLRLPRAVSYRSFWFAWAAMFPETDFYAPPPPPETG